MANEIKQDWNELLQLISDIRSFLVEIPPHLPLGTVVKTDTGLIGVVTGVDAPEQPNHPWSYAVCLPNTDDYIDESRTFWFDADQLEVMHWQRELSCES